MLDGYDCTGRSWLYCTVRVGHGCTVRYWSVLYGTGRCCTVLVGAVRQCTGPCCTSVYRSVLYVRVLYRAVRHWCTVPCCTSLVYYRAVRLWCITVLYVNPCTPGCASLVYSWLCLLGVLLLCIPPCTNGCASLRVPTAVALRVPKTAARGVTVLHRLLPVVYQRQSITYLRIDGYPRLIAWSPVRLRITDRYSHGADTNCTSEYSLYHSGGCGWEYYTVPTVTLPFRTVTHTDQQ